MILALGAVFGVLAVLSKAKEDPKEREERERVRRMDSQRAADSYYASAPSSQNPTVDSDDE
jgi:hypothetical protein